MEFFAEMLSSEDEQVRRSYRANLKSRMGDVSLYMEELKQRFSIWYNRSRKRSETLWAERFKGVLVQDDPVRSLGHRRLHRPEPRADWHRRWFRQVSVLLLRRRDGPRAMRGSDWGGLCCIRDLRRDTFG